jgi:hypothetical protein
MANQLISYLAVEVEITIMSGLGGLPFIKFHPDNPFIKRNDCRPLPWWDSCNKFESRNFFGSEFYWVSEEELTIYPPSLDLNKAFNCFNQIKPTGAKYSIKLCVDVPNNDRPMLIPPLVESETGHSFIVVTKANGNRSVTQVFGFYAVTHPGYLFPFRPIDSAIKNNQLREINASIETGLTEAQFEMIRKKASELAKKKYAAADYNCTNFALDLFNSVRPKPITIETYTIYLPVYNSYLPTESTRLTIDKTPQMLFKKLKEMKDNKDIEASRIVIDTTTRTKAPLSHGECN